MSGSSDTIRVVIPPSIRKRNGRQNILPPEDHCAREGRTQDPHVLRAIGRAWGWRRKLERDEVSTLAEIANKSTSTLWGTAHPEISAWRVA
jgi:hypothetical protein